MIYDQWQQMRGAENVQVTLYIANPQFEFLANRIGPCLPYKLQCTT
jgi:hypothetical protein